MKSFFDLRESLQEATFMVTIRKGKFGGVTSDGRPTMVTARSEKEAVTRAAKKVGIDSKLITTGDYTVKSNTKEEVELDEAKIEVGDRVRVKDDAKKVVDRNLLGKSGVVLPNGMGGSSIRVKFADGRTAMFNKNDLEVNESVDQIDELSKDTLRRYDDANELDRERLSGKIGMVKGKMTPDQKKTLAKLQKRVKGADAVSRKLYPGAYKEAKDAAKDTYFNTYSAAVQHAKAQAEKQGYEVEEDDWFDQVTTGKGKPGNGKTTRHVLKLMKNGKPTRKGLAIQVYNRGSDKNPYELNFYVS